MEWRNCMSFTLFPISDWELWTNSEDHQNDDWKKKWVVILWLMIWVVGGEKLWKLPEDLGIEYDYEK